MRVITTTYLGAPPYCYAGAVSCVSHEGTRAMRVVWRLHHALPPVLFYAAKPAAG